MTSELRVRVPKTIPDEDRAYLEAILATAYRLDASSKRALDPQWIELVGTLKQVGEVAGATAAVLGLAREIVEWARLLRKRGIDPKVELHADADSPLNLSVATEQEAGTWLSRRRA